MEKYGRAVLAAAESVPATPFELGTALALTAFNGERVDAAVVEVGLGGRLDPTNVVEPTVCAITAIGMDHMDFLGNTLTEIAGEKAGIIKPGVPVVCQPGEPGVEAVFREKAEAAGAPLTQSSREQVTNAVCGARGSRADFHLAEEWPGLELGLPGEHQLLNALTALAVIEVLREQGFAIPREAVYEGMKRVFWPARLEWCGNILLDGGHNAQGIEALSGFVHAHLEDRRRVLLVGVLREKLSREMLLGLAGLGEPVFTVTPDSPRAMPAEELAAALREAGCGAEAAGTLREGLTAARRAAGEDGTVIAAGSLYLMGELRSLLGLGWKQS